MGKKNLHKAKGHQKEQKEFEEEVLQIDRVTRVVKGGRRLRFRATVAIGDKKGRVGIGIGKASEVVSSIKKAVTRAKKDLIKVPITSGDTIPHEVKIKYKASRLIIIPASPGTGVIAGGSLRKILNLAGIKNVLSKNIGSRNPLVTAQASIKALQALRPLRGYEKAKADAKVPVKEEAKNPNEEESKAPVKYEPKAENKVEPKTEIKAEPEVEKKEKKVELTIEEKPKVDKDEKKADKTDS